MVAGKKLVVIEKDDHGQPDVGKALLAAAHADDKVDIAVGPTASPVALTMVPVAEEYKKILLVEHQVADSITGEKWNRYIFRIGRRDRQRRGAGQDLHHAGDAGPGQRLRQGRRQGLPRSGQEGQDRPRGIPARGHHRLHQRIIEKLKDQPGRKIVWIIWAGGTPLKVADLDLQRENIEMASGGNILPAMAAYKQFPGMEGGLCYYFGIPKNPVK